MEILTEKEQQQLIDTIGEIDKFQGKVQEGEMCNLEKENYQKVKICDFKVGTDKLIKKHIQFALDWFTPVSKILTQKFSEILHKNVRVHVLSIDTVNHHMLWKYVTLPTYTGKFHYKEDLDSWIIPGNNLVNWLLHYPIEDRNDKDLSKKDEKTLYKQCYKPVSDAIYKGLESVAKDNNKILYNAELKYDGLKIIQNYPLTNFEPKSYCLITLSIEPVDSVEASKPTNVAELNIAINARAVRMIGDNFMGIKFEKGNGVSRQILDDVKLPVHVMLGKNKLTTSEMLDLEQGQIIQLDKIAGTDLELVFGDKTIAYGEVVIDSQEHYGIRITGFPKEKE